MKRVEFTQTQIPDRKATILHDPSLLADGGPQAFEPEFWQAQGKVIGTAKGRGTTWFVDCGTTDAALRFYRRGGLIGKLISRNYFYTGLERTRSYRELKLLGVLADAGVNVPRPIAALVVRSGLFCYQAALLSEKVAEARDLVAILSENSLGAEQYRSIGRQIKKMHQAQVNHTDLNIHNILIDSSQTVWIIDFDKCYQQQGEKWKQSNLERLKRSFEKERTKVGIHWQESDWQALIDGWKEG